MRIEDFITRAGEMISLADNVLRTIRQAQMGHQWVDKEQFQKFRSSCLSFLLNILGEYSPYYTEFNKNVNHETPYDVQRGRGILSAV
jgi:hypothetical protein